MSDGHDTVRWWHRNPVHQPQSVALYGWDDGVGFFPDFIVSIDGRKSEHGIVLVEVKGAHRWGELSEVRKIAGGRHPQYGETVAVGRKPGERFKLLKPDGERLIPFADFDMAQLRLAFTP